MSRVHGSWLTSEKGYFFLWGETWRASADLQSTSVPCHPYNSTQQELTLALEESNISLEKIADLTNLEARWIEQVIFLPSEAEKTGQFVPILSGTIDREHQKQNPIDCILGK